MSFVVGNVPTHDKNSSEKYLFRNSLDEVVKGVPSRNHLLFLMGANARTGVQGIEWTDREVVGAYERDELNDNGKRLLLRTPQQTTNSPSSMRTTPYLPVVYRTRFRAEIEERPNADVITY